MTRLKGLKPMSRSNMEKAIERLAQELLAVVRRSPEISDTGRHVYRQMDTIKKVHEVRRTVRKLWST